MELELFSSDELLALAAIDLEKNELALGLEKLKLMRKKGVVSDELDSMLGSVYAKLQLFIDAAECYSRLLERAPSRVHERFQLGMVYREIGEIDKALEHWDMVLGDEPNYPPVLFHKAVLLLNNNDESECRYLLTLLIESAEEDNYYAQNGKKLIDELNSGDTSQDTNVLENVH
ncbi:TPR_REGION domain-containing protein [Vibrio chagasii]|uniref:tetratricopeptide repeat protein n=1 Tax=Vibrio chagasii TaxID=170679 RepID=UPI001F116E40|nr:tetratricopeptide repeat protein [Vibrio chagasii]CAH7138883.1 TPR_REGION domain-containing protein [Vibrio chagasii]